MAVRSIRHDDDDTGGSRTTGLAPVVSELPRSTMAFLTRNSVTWRQAMGGSAVLSALAGSAFALGVLRRGKRNQR